MKPDNGNDPGGVAEQRDLLNLDDYVRAAERKLDRAVYDYYAGGSWDEITLRENSQAYDRLQLLYRVLRDVSSRELATTVLGSKIDLPILLAPTAFQGMADPDGEVATVRAAGSLGTIMIVSTLSNRSIESITAAASSPVWFQLYVYRDRGATRALIERAEAAGCQAIVLTVDAQVWGERERDVRNRFRLPEGLKMSNLFAGKEDLPKNVGGSGLASYVTSMFDSSLSWEDLKWIRSVCGLPLVIKGIMHPEDARLAVEHGVDAIIVSNHGGRQLDTAPATIEVLPEVCAATDGRTEVLVDGGIRRGSDVVKALALGARAVAIGRPALYGLAVGGQTGVEKVLSILRRELDLVMGLCGATSVSELGSDLVHRPKQAKTAAPG